MFEVRLNLFDFASKVRLKNLFSVCDAAAELECADRKSISELSGISVQTVIKAIEILLDGGILGEDTSRKPFRYSVSDKRPFAAVDLSRSNFKFDICTSDASVVRELASRYDFSYFFDENLSFFLHEAAVFTEKRLSVSSLSSIAVLVPHDPDLLTGTRSILSHKERLVKLVGEYFGDRIRVGVHDICRVTASVFENGDIYEGTSVICTSDEASVICIVAAAGAEPVIARLRGAHGAPIPADLQGGALHMHELAASLGNIISMFCPKRLVIDGVLRNISEEKLCSELSKYLSDADRILPEITVFESSLAIKGVSKAERDERIRAFTTGEPL